MPDSKTTLFSRFSMTLLSLSFLGFTACSGGGGSGQAKLPDDPTEETFVDTSSSSKIEPIDDGGISSAQRVEILKSYDHLDPEKIVPSRALEEAVIYLHQNKSRFANQNYISVINYAQSSRMPRFYIIEMKSGSVWSIRVAHGKGSDPSHDGFPETFSNVSGSGASSLGVYKVGDSFTGSYGTSLRLDGLSETNSNARARGLVIHGADYVQEIDIIQGRNWGSPAVALETLDNVVKYLKGGSLLYATEEPSLPSTPTTPGASPPPAPPAYVMQALAWETSSQPQRKQWSQYLQDILLTEWSSLLTGASDMKDFCPKYNSLNNNQRANAWAQLFVAMAKYESNYNPLSRMHETTMGTDPVTKKPVYSEGLLQLSYQDKQSSPFCKFDWNKDKNLSSTDPKKTILDPYINLHCGVGIMAKQIAKYGKIKIGSGAYWAVIKTNSQYEKISSITSIVKSLPLCQ